MPAGLMGVDEASWVLGLNSSEDIAATFGQPWQVLDEPLSLLKLNQAAYKVAAPIVETGAEYFGDRGPKIWSKCSEGQRLAKVENIVRLL